MNVDELLKDLTEPQRQAAAHIDGPLLIIAGAGSGKTRVITRRVAYLIANGILPSSIVSITFTNKAAGEMKSRVSALAGKPLRDFGRLDQPWPILCTFHSLGLRILKHYATRLGIPENFTIYDSDDQSKLVKQAIAQAEVAPDRFPPARVHHAISQAKNKLLTAEMYGKMVASTDYFRRNIALVYKHYQKLLEKNHAMDFDDLLMRVAIAFREHPDVLHELQERFQYILIDEYQDTNHAQYIVAHALAQKHRNICVVGDPDQSIYAWRGADINNILDFERDYPDAKVVKLEQNYRSSQNILDIASKLIAGNTQRKEKGLFTDRGPGEKALLLVCEDERAEAMAVAKRLRELHETKNYTWSQMAVFYRMNALSRVVEDAFRREQIPYRIARGVDFYHRKEIKDVLAYLRVVQNPDDEVSMTRIINSPPRGISDATLRQMQLWALDKGWSLWQTAQYVQNIGSLQTRAVKAVQQFVQLVARWQGQALLPPDELPWSGGENPLGRVAGLVNEIVRTSGMEAALDKLSDPESDTSPVNNVRELVSAAAEYDEENPDGSLEDYLGRISLVSDTDKLDETGAITLMTLHAAKGLEFPVVAMVAMEENCLPHARVQEQPEQLEEERRLCFVGITRAQHELILSHARSRTIRGLHERTMASRFLAEMPRELLKVVKVEDPLALDDADAIEEELTRGSPYKRGQVVRHPMFGTGMVKEVSKMGRQTRLIVEFTRHGRKTLIAEYARLTRG